ncbi:uncharacterized protein At4g19900 isoform X2 [Prosopis cineraria]|uniref:uncharacterized protein At4g19900 isoform X2 n=1 Tax=Prosopis cineraria TaxID=364024 RepID=UPI00240E9F2A|nr:uncharacterized protein At4g19900 isoform X2 [Prosopis cineraria]
MLRFLRSRRRFPYGSYLRFAVPSLILLLLSVPFLHSLLSRSLPHPHILHEPFHEDEGDSWTGKIEDAIDEIDIIDENHHQRQKEPADLGDGYAGSNSRIKGSGYFFDHVTGCIRRGFNKRSIEEWDDNGAGFLAGSGMEEDRSKAAFASDDTPVDEHVRRKAAQVIGIEDALLLKLGTRVSPLREGWGDWFEKKGEFFKKNKMFKSNWAALDPMNNLMLQDPDGVSLTRFTEGDRNLQNWWMNEFNRTPFLGQKTLDRSKETRDSDLQENDNEAVNYNASACNCKTRSNRESRSETKGTERRTLNDDVRNGADNVAAFKSDGDSRSEVEGAERWNLNENVGEGSTEKDLNSGIRKYAGSEEQDSETGQDNNAAHVGKLDRSSGSKDVASEIQRRPEFLNHIYADGKRMGKCDMRVFMVWNSPPWMYSVRHQRGLESLLYHHRDVCVIVFSETIELDFFKYNFVNDGYKVAVAMPNLDELLKDTPTQIFASIWFEWRQINFYSTHYSELIRLAALYKYGGIYLDSDIIVLKPISSLNNSVGMEDHIAGSALNGAVMAFRRHSLFIKECLREFYLTYDDTNLRWNGADLLTRVARNFLKGRNKYVKQMELQEQPSYMFFPISSQNITRFFMAPTSGTEKAQQDSLFRKIFHESLTFHFWNSLTSALVPEPESLVARLINYYCIRCMELL